MALQFEHPLAHSPKRRKNNDRILGESLTHPERCANSDALTYLENVEATFEPYGGKWLALDAQVEVQEGEWPGSVVLMEFPDMNAAKQWYGSPGIRR